MKEKGFQLLSIVLVGLFMITLCSCGKEEPNNNKGQSQGEQTVWYLGGNNVFAGNVDVKSLFEGVEDSVDPIGIYNSLNYTETMLHGSYTLNNKEKELPTVREEIPFIEIQSKSGKTNKLSALPTAVYLGADNICCSETRYRFSEYESITDQEAAVIEFATEEKVGQTPIHL